MFVHFSLMLTNGKLLSRSAFLNNTTTVDLLVDRIGMFYIKWGNLTTPKPSFVFFRENKGCFGCAWFKYLAKRVVSVVF